MTKLEGLCQPVEMEFMLVSLLNVSDSMVVFGSLERLWEESNGHFM